MLLSFLAITASFGMNREYRFEVVIISITWIELIITGILISLFFKRRINKSLSDPGRVGKDLIDRD